MNLHILLELIILIFSVIAAGFTWKSLACYLNITIAVLTIILLLRV